MQASNGDEVVASLKCVEAEFVESTTRQVGRFHLRV